MSVLLSPTPSIIAEEKERDHRIHNWISELRAHSPVDAFSPPSLPATSDLTDLTPNPTAPTYNNEPQWQHSATRRSMRAPGPAGGYIGARDVRIPSNGARNREVPALPGPMPTALIGQYALTGNVAMPVSAPPVLPNSRGAANGLQAPGPSETDADFLFSYSSNDAIWLPSKPHAYSCCSSWSLINPSLYTTSNPTCAHLHRIPCLNGASNNRYSSFSPISVSFA